MTKFKKAFKSVANIRDVYFRLQREIYRWVKIAQKSY